MVNDVGPKFPVDVTEECWESGQSKFDFKQIFSKGNESNCAKKHVIE